MENQSVEIPAKARKSKVGLKDEKILEKKVRSKSGKRGPKKKNDGEAPIRSQEYFFRKRKECIL